MTPWRHGVSRWKPSTRDPSSMSFLPHADTTRPAWSNGEHIDRNLPVVVER